jgi:hypothetical protein
VEVVIVHEVEQGSDSWKALRLGVVTGSEFDNILTPKELKPAKGTAYLNRLVAEILTGESQDDFDGNAFTDRGTAMEDEARRWYAFDRGVALTRVGFITRDDGRVGVSPDSLVGEDGGLEIKCPGAKAHVGYALDHRTLVTAYRGQVQASLYITGRKWWDLLSYNPGFEKLVVRCVPDAEYLAALVPALDAFLARIDAAVAQLRPSLDLCPL